MAARGRQTLSFQISSIETSDSSLERYREGDQKMSFK